MKHTETVKLHFHTNLGNNFSASLCISINTKIKYFSFLPLYGKTSHVLKISDEYRQTNYYNSKLNENEFFFCIH